MPRDQLDNFTNAGYVAQPKQCLFHAAARMADRPDGPSEIAQGGTRGGAKTHAAMAQTTLDDCIRVPGLRWLFLRGIKRSAAEAFEDLISRVLKYESHEYVRSEGLLKFPNGSHVICGGFRSDSDIDNYLGLEYDGVTVEEANTIKPKKLDMVYGSIRSGRDDWRPRKYLSFNPGGVGHQELRKRFVIPWRDHTETTTRFVFSSYEDNVFLDQGYLDYLNNLTGILRLMWHDGDFDISAGMALPDFTERHIVDPFVPPDNWPKVRAHDYGFVHPFFTLWRAKEPSTGRIFIYREWTSRYLSEELQARGILDLTKEKGISTTFASPDLWEHKAGKNQQVTTRAQEFIDEGCLVIPADNARANGLVKIHNLLADLPDGKPALQITRDCVALIECLQSMLSDPNKPEDVLKVDADPETGEDGDDGYDCLRYILTDAKATPIPKPKHQPLPLQNLVGRRT
jgi:hypothetical protein